GTSAKMLSIVPLMNGGGLFETGAGGSAPKHVQQLQKENHLRWDSLGEFLALAMSFEHLANRFGNDRAGLLGKTLDTATGELLEKRKSPSRVSGELDNRGSHYYLAAFWAKALAEQDDDAELKEKFTEPARKLAENEKSIVEELNGIQGFPVDFGGYYKPDKAAADAVMRPCALLNGIIDSI
ncbi:MAG: NADP-dependent isocitrate dehydrogenase, partial [Spirochaetaceae bacterium]|nr:NADP-dependent isocitrate dehydrogenase [Spirochaetaceae bacterium]